MMCCVCSRLRGVVFMKVCLLAGLTSSAYLRASESCDVLDSSESYQQHMKTQVINGSIGVIGEGAWGTAVASVLANNGYQVNLWCCDKQVAKQINQEHFNERYIPGFSLSPNIVAHVDLKEVARLDWVFISTPIKYFRDVVNQCKSYYRMNQRWIILSKGIENDTLMLPSQILSQILSPRIHFAALGGPSFAKEVLEKKVTGVNIAANDQTIANDVALLVKNEYFRPFVIDDFIGIQLGGALKNVVAIMMGIAKGVTSADNTQALLFTRGWHEMSALALALGAEHKTLEDLSGVGDLFLTVSGRYSRNLSVGKALGQGKKLDVFLRETGYTPEGINTIKTVKQIIHKYQLKLPLLDLLYAIVFDQVDPSQLVHVAAHEVFV